ncbi:MAG: hypothetical protein HFH46_03625 [Bacilli bacterium]|nr:hypothetical protein [Bacilli bacterium]
MNNMNMNWMMNPSNLFGKRDAGRSCNQYASRPAHNYMHEIDKLREKINTMIIERR